MLHVLTAQIVADERERAIQRRLGKRSALLEARAARAAEPDRGQDPGTPAAGRPSREGPGRIKKN